jgi:chromosome segregation protein
MEFRSNSLKEQMLVDEKAIESLIIKNEDILQGFRKDKSVLDDDISNLKIELSTSNEQLISEKHEFSIINKQKENLVSDLDELKKKEISIQATIQKNEERLDKLYQDKEALGIDNKAIEDLIKSNSSQLCAYEKQNETLSDSIQEKENDLKYIEEKALNYYSNEKRKYENELKQIRSNNKKIDTELKAKNSKQADLLLQEAKESARNIENEASELFRVAEEKEKHASQIEVNAENEFSQQKAKVNEELLRKLHDVNSEAKDIKTNAISEYEMVLTSAKEKSIEIIEQAKVNSEERIERAKAEAKEFFISGKSGLEKAQEKATELINLAQDKALQIQNNGLKELEDKKLIIETENKKMLEDTNQLKEQKEFLSHGVSQ